MVSACGHDQHCHATAKSQRKQLAYNQALQLSLLSFSALVCCCGRYCKAYKIACDRGVRKYFEHAGALITADGTGDELIKLEGMPKNYKFTF